MSNLVVVEMRRALHRRLVRWMVALAVAGCVLMGVIAFATSDTVDRFDEGHPAVVEDWGFGTDGEPLLGIAAVFLAIGAGICGASVAGAEWRAGTITTLLTWVPSRRRLHLARTTSAFVLAFVIGTVLQLVFLGAALPAALAAGTTGGADGAWRVDLALSIARISLVTALVAVLAVSVATLGRNTAAALVALAGYALVVENLVRGLRPGLARFLVGENVATVVQWVQLDDVEFHRPPGLALATLAAYLAVAVVAATVAFARRDVASA